ncbi:cytosolic phospholipase A2 beta-like [Hippocampus zosterae]|uniref:cytosolic phospholipase A2 beta-like n=1 Tax=Hippocampus zosterae TaxID=109293 RepID=UPI00223DC192|nr:cytosolic phospholipase A2 beta-like [Hippocampus zosterae]
MILHNEAVSSHTLTVTVLKAENIRAKDFGSESDCYVTLILPPAIVFKTTTVENDKNPEWNQSFNFTLHNNFQTTLQIHLYDEDPLFDELIQTMVIDISTLTEGKTEIKEFAIQPEGKLWIAFTIKESERKAVSTFKGFSLGKEGVSYWKLNVTVLKAKLGDSKDYFSESDCYVSLYLPTANASAFNTKTVQNNNNPEWNETFTFRVPSHLKNVLEIRLLDEDPVSDDLLSMTMYDLSNLTLGKKERIAFNLNSETTNQILILFEMLQSEEPPSDYVSNGILLAPPFSALDVNVDKLLNNYDSLGKTIKLCGACPENQSLTAKEATRLRFFINRDLATELGLATSAVDAPSSVARLQPLPPEHTCKVSLVIDQDTVDLDVETHECVDDHIAVRLDFDIPPQEKEFLKKRKLIVGQNMQKLFGLDSPPSASQVPTIAVVGSGGGSRAMTSLLGSLKSLKEIQVLDIVSYITGVSGSTWTMSALFRDANWSQDGIDRVIAEIRKEICKDALSILTLEKMEYYRREMEEKIKEGHILSHTDLAGLLYEQTVFGEKVVNTLSEQRKTVNEGQNPLPIYTAVNMKERMGCESEAEWCEFTPYEVGFQKYGAFVRAEDYGSQFFLGHLIRKLPEIRISYLIGIWSSFFAVTMSQLMTHASDETVSGPHMDNKEPENEPLTLDTQHMEPSSVVSRIISDVLMNRPFSSKEYNFMHGLFLHSSYNTHSNFTAWKESHPDAFANLLTPSDSFLQLIDSGHCINIGCAPVLRPEREVDIFICFDNSWTPSDIFKELKLTASYCQDHDMPFPRIDFTTLEEQPQREVYILEDMENPKAPVVIYFPLVNDSFRYFKEPGVKRETAEEIKAGEVDVKSSNSPFKTEELVYSPENFDSLVNLTAYNVANNKEIIIETLRKVLKSKMDIKI